MTLLHRVKIMCHRCGRNTTTFCDIASVNSRSLHLICERCMEEVMTLHRVRQKRCLHCDRIATIFCDLCGTYMCKRCEEDKRHRSGHECMARWRRKK